MKPEKVTKESVNYRHSDSQIKKCLNCAMFNLNMTCTHVKGEEGEIKPGDVCDDWSEWRR